MSLSMQLKFQTVTKYVRPYGTVLNYYRILGIIHERKVSRMNFFGIIREKTFEIQPIPGNLIARILGNIHERKIL